ncbi:MAG TPA: TrkA family potassium uptake protein [Caproiciproducens sp.]|jgi:K+ transport systems, NAD-binding component|nr:TrkA family potassium uptake protein [Caproiciproducens sp.]
MKVIIVGCGKLGSGLARSLVQKSHHVTVIDSNPEAFEMLGKDFKGETIVGIGFDRDILEQAQIQLADAIVACSKSDEANALIGRVARNVYKVPRVISRLYDPRKAEIYRTLGIQTISTTTWGIERTIEMLSYGQLDSVLTLGDSNVELIRIETPALLIGRTVNELTVYGEIQVVAISRENKSFLPTMGTALHKHDVIYIAALSTSAKKLKSMLGMA